MDPAKSEPCPSCGKLVRTRAKKCIYCGALLQPVEGREDPDKALLAATLAEQREQDEAREEEARRRRNAQDLHISMGILFAVFFLAVGAELFLRGFDFTVFISGATETVGVALLALGFKITASALLPTAEPFFKALIVAVGYLLLLVAGLFILWLTQSLAVGIVEWMVGVVLISFLTARVYGTGLALGVGITLIGLLMASFISFLAYSFLGVIGYKQ